MRFTPPAYSATVRWSRLGIPGVGLARRRAYTLLESLVAIAILATLVGLLLPAVQRVRGRAARLQCQNNMRQLGLALHGFHDANRVLPPGCSYSSDRDPYPHMSWLTRILPYMEAGALWQQATAAFQQESFFLTPPHFPIFGHSMPSYNCPSNPFGQNELDIGVFHIAYTSYLGVSGTSASSADGVLFLNSSVPLTGISDGTSQTIAVAERPRSPDGALGWWYAGWGQAKNGSAEMHLGTRELNAYPKYQNCPPGPYHFVPGAITNDCDVFHFWSGHRNGANFLFTDGSVHFLAHSTDSVLPALGTRAGNEVIPLDL